MWCLGRYLPILIGDLIPDDYPYWENYLKHLDIMDEIFAPVTTPERIDYVGMLIEDFLGEFKDLYPDRPVTPKMHYLVHIPTWMKRYTLSNNNQPWIQLPPHCRCGPLIRMWCMRYEAKHRFFKHISSVVRNFRNAPKTLATRHQHYMCYQMLEPSTYLHHHTTHTGGRYKAESTQFT